MSSEFVLYGATGYVGADIARQAVERGLRPVLAGRDALRLEKLADELGLECRVFDLHDPQKIEQVLKDATVVLHCAGPFINTFKPMVEACLNTRTHYLDLTGEFPVYQAIANLGAEARLRGVMLLPGVGFDVVPTDCLAVHLKQRLPAATSLTLAFKVQGPAGLPPGTQRTVIEMIPFGDRVRRDGRLEPPAEGAKTRLIDFGQGPELATRLTWGDVFTAYYSTGIPNIEDYLVMSKSLRQQMAFFDNFRSIFNMPILRNILKRAVSPGASVEKLSRTTTHVWGEVEDGQGHRAVSRLHGPEPGVVWTARAALAAVEKVLAGGFKPGFQTPGLMYGPEFVLECEGVTREDIE
ncbi:MAG TPA: saccharopine dehydrogenase NADP-binding domain-containing protein [Anaerolineales bacterium]